MMVMAHDRGVHIRASARTGWCCAFALFVAMAAAGAPCAAQAPPSEMAADTSAEQAPPGEMKAIVATAPDPLSRARNAVQEYFDKFADLSCRESVTQFVLNGSGHAIYRENSAYDYQIQASSASGTWKFAETRTVRNPSYRDPARTLLVTSGFSSLLLIAHPMYEASYVFVPAGNETIDGVSYALIRFSSVPGASSPVSLRLRGRNYPMPLSGALWIEPQSGAIVKLEAIVDSSMSDLGLAGMRSEVHYARHTFNEPQATVWVADSAVIDVETPRQHWRNVHHFTDFKRFSVNIQQEIGTLP